MTSRRRYIDTLTSLYDEIDIITIPAGTRLHLWDNNDITDAHFISSGDLDVLVRKGHGSMYKLLQQYVGDESNRVIDEIKNLPIVKDILHTDDRIRYIANTLADKYRSMVDAVMMAYTTDGKIGLLFIQEGSTIPVDELLR